MRNIPVVLLAIVLLIAPLSCTKQISDDAIVAISSDELYTLIQESSRHPDRLVLIDPRSTRAYREAHLPGALHLTIPAVQPNDPRDPRIEDRKNIIVYGNDPADPAARGMSKRLLSAGYKGVRMFMQGLKEWRRLGYPIDHAEQPASTPSGSR